MCWNVKLLKDCFKNVFRLVGEYRKTEHAAAVKIQSWFRGCRVRAYIRYLNMHQTKSLFALFSQYFSELISFQKYCLLYFTWCLGLKITENFQEKLF